ncbi:DUF4199 domain-containing protein [Myroides ceti]|uniref:DUF4199 domain-containing protein n=1 Tax=Paenimyroides ceti TaxID=395087 RepID=A0ABT8CPT8_9FLAO|nr:DUF4199 domain-containing protein [Paenimyroides ceti]MDN3706517.1 DUF4199 domain-containing protein [Paenimyroides ceti]
MNTLGIELKWAAIFTLAYCAWNFVEKITGNHIDFSNIIISGFLYLLVVIVLGFLAFRDKKKNFYAGKWDFNQAFKFGLFLTGMVALLSPIAHYISYNSISPDYFEHLIQYELAKGRETREALLEKHNFDDKMYLNLRDILSYGVVFSALFAYLLKTKNYKAPVKVIAVKPKTKKVKK